MSSPRRWTIPRAAPAALVRPGGADARHHLRDLLIATTQSWWLILYLGLLLWLEWLGDKGWRMVLAVIATWLLVTLGVALAPDSGFAALIGWSHRGLILGLLCILGLLGYSQLLELLRRHEVALPDRAPGLLSRVTDGGGPAIAPPQPDRSLSDAELTRYAAISCCASWAGRGRRPCAARAC